MACVWKLPGSKPTFWIAQFRGPEGLLNGSAKPTGRRKALRVAETWESASEKARLVELIQAVSIRILGGLMELALRPNEVSYGDITLYRDPIITSTRKAAAVLGLSQ